MHHLTYVRGPFVNNIYVLVASDGATAAVVDPGLECDDVMDDIARRGLQVALLLNTHGHLDHAGGNASFARRFGAPLVAHAADRFLRESLPVQGSWIGLDIPLAPSPEPDRLLAGGEVLQLADEEIRVLHTPGHTPGGCCFLVDRSLYSGDTLFNGSVGRTDLPGGDTDQLLTSIREVLYGLGDDVDVFPGHGEPTTIGFERRHNPFVTG